MVAEDTMVNITAGITANTMVSIMANIMAMKKIKKANKQTMSPSKISEGIFLGKIYKKERNNFVIFYADSTCNVNKSVIYF